MSAALVPLESHSEHRWIERDQPRPALRCRPIPRPEGARALPVARSPQAIAATGSPPFRTPAPWADEPSPDSFARPILPQPAQIPPQTSLVFAHRAHGCCRRQGRASRPQPPVTPLDPHRPRGGGERPDVPAPCASLAAFSSQTPGYFSAAMLIARHAAIRSGVTMPSGKLDVPVRE